MRVVTVIQARALLFALLVVLSLVLAGAATLYAASTNRGDARAARDFAVQIDKERRRTIRASCEDSNARHDGTIKQLDKIIAELPRGERRTRARQNHDGTVLLIDALVPKRDCDAVVRAATAD